ncbi:hypothetical protein LZ30DRAFT_237506 [Colletotrichum cereale]|nr:hypothetical protein LZ30DRAFT_237506 [Colletotrichum cereale]
MKPDASLRATAGQPGLAGSDLPAWPIFHFSRASNSKRQRSIGQAPGDGTGGMGLMVASNPRAPGRIANLCACGTYLVGPLRHAGLRCAFKQACQGSSPEPSFLRLSCPVLKLRFQGNTASRCNLDLLGRRWPSNPRDAATYRYQWHSERRKLTHKHTRDPALGSKRAA